MSDVIKILQEADAAAVLVEQSRQKYEMAKTAMEKAKALLEEDQESLNQVFLKAEEEGLSRSKLKKLIEERTNALMASGLMMDLGSVTPKAPKAPKKKNTPPADMSPIEDLHEEISTELQ